MGKSYSIMCKPVGYRCNLNCSYCYYLEKESLNSSYRLMFQRVLETFIRDYIELNTIDVMEFIWQGGEPMLAGIPFYESALRLQKKYNKGEK